MDSFTSLHTLALEIPCFRATCPGSREAVESAPPCVYAQGKCSLVNCSENTSNCVSTGPKSIPTGRRIHLTRSVPQPGSDRQSAPLQERAGTIRGMDPMPYDKTAKSERFSVENLQAGCIIPAHHAAP